MVLALGITFVILRVRGGDASHDDREVATATSIAAPPEPPRPPAAPVVRREPPAPAPSAETPPAEVPEWERKPLRTAQPFPEEARIDPPTPPMKIPPEMLIPLGTPDAGAP